MPNKIRLLFIGDIVGSPGRKALKQTLPFLKREFSPNFIVANGENAAGGYGLTEKIAEELLELGIDVLTSGNHIWRREFLPYLDRAERVIRPANYPQGAPGRGYALVEKEGLLMGVINLEGRIFMRPLDCPFRLGQGLAQKLREKTPLILVDFHAEATSEKIALSFHLDGLVTAVVGTHTHVQTADERVLPGGSAYITDVGMTGMRESVIGMRPDQALELFLLQVPRKLEVPKRGPAVLEAVLIEAEDTTGRALSIIRLRKFL
ncbi:TIGR00282 family metallophosphoesterase [Thermosulfuriphilus sp.]